MTQTVLCFGALALIGILLVTPMILIARDLSLPTDPGEKDRCPVCGMLVAPYTEWIAQVRHGDGTTVFFDGNKDLFKYLLSLDRYATEKRREEVASVFVTNYYDGEIIEARTAFYVVGSDVLGPMGTELISHRSIEAAEDFLKDHDGRRILRFDEITKAVLRELNS